MQRAFFALIRLLLIPVILFALFLLFFTVFEYRPKEETELFSSLAADTLSTGVSYSSLVWNIGYAGLGENMDFFYDGGENVRDTKENVIRNVDAISRFLSSNDTVNFILLQEVDQSSKRSYYINQLHFFDSLLSDHDGFLGINYQVGFVPVPVHDPLGKVKSGIATFSAKPPLKVTRYSFDANYPWPKRLFMLKRCFLVTTFPVINGKELNVINIHNSAYDDGTLRANQLTLLNEYALDQYTKGNYILFGGDWNQSPDTFKPEYNQPFDTINLSYLPSGFLRDWRRIFCDTIPTNRRIKTPYTRGVTTTTVIDYFIVSPNITVLQVNPQELNFKNSDHQPLIIRFTLNE